MVNSNIVSEYSGGPDPGDRVKIGGGPLYALQRVQALVADAGHVFLWTRKCRHDVQNLGWDVDDVAQLLDSLTAKHYIDSEWCNNGQGAWAACDAYEVLRREWVAAAHREFDIRYFLKFAMGKAGALVLTVSCHT